MSCRSGGFAMEIKNSVTKEIEMVWLECLKIMEKKLGRPTFETCLRNTHPLSLDKESLIISVPNNFAKTWIQDRYIDLISRTFQNLAGKKYVLEFSVCEETLKDNKNYKNKSENIFNYKQSKYETFLNPKYTFDTFVVGSGNHFAHAASVAVSDSPAKAYNPLFIYGGVGLGKTHLMHAIGNAVVNKDGFLKVVYSTTEQFTNELINSIREHQTIKFRNKYRSVDILLIDDIQFLVNKESTQEEFFHTFNELHGANKQIVITSDRPPKEIPTIESRLLSRFEWGLIADIQKPDVETREAILRKKAENEKVMIPYEIISFIAEKIPSNIRELEGALIKVIAFASLNKSELSINMAREALKNVISNDEEKNITISIIQRRVCEYYGIKISQLTGEKRDQKFVYPRQIAMYLSKEITGFSLPLIGKEFGGKDHTTVLHSCRKISENLKNPHLANAIENIKNLLTSPC